ncbi:MAG: hypothetical protein JXA11_13850 [Phycisphaerae bacterium]|nr:hypothetical protein [Phycisphaerae bacterium]
MADEQVVKRIDWSEVFSFPHIFKSFKMASHPSKLVLGLLVIVLVAAGGYVLDTVWSVGGGTVREKEILMYVATPPGEYQRGLEAHEKKQLSDAANLKADAHNQRHGLMGFLGAWSQSSKGRGGVAIEVFRANLDKHNKNNEADASYDTVSGDQMLKRAKDEKQSVSELVDDADDKFSAEMKKIDDLLDDVDEDAEKKIEEMKLADEKEDEAMDDIAFAMAAAEQAKTARRMQFARAKRDVKGVGIYESFIDYQSDCVRNAILSIRHLNFLGGLTEYQKMVQSRHVPPASLEIDSGLPKPMETAPKDETAGAVVYLLMMAEGLRFLILEHWVFATILLLWMLIVWSLLGGAMYRIAAVQFAREEKISIPQALKFSLKRFLSFFSAPLVPIVIIVVVALLLTLGGLIGSIPVVGSLFMGLLFGLAILLGVGAAFMLIGLLAGWPLMYPTIAAEGSDSFDAISRSFSYIFARPFRALLYGFVAAIYGTITYLFVRFFAYLSLLLTHTFVKIGVLGGGDALSTEADKLDVFWQRPDFWNLHTLNTHATGFWGDFCGVLIAIWVLIVVGLVASYLLTFFASSSTAIYFVLRRRVDATDLDDVYVEEEEETLAPAEDTPAEEEKSEAPAEESKDDEEEKA